MECWLNDQAEFIFINQCRIVNLQVRFKLRTIMPQCSSKAYIPFRPGIGSSQSMLGHRPEMGGAEKLSNHYLAYEVVVGPVVSYRLRCRYQYKSGHTIHSSFRLLVRKHHVVLASAYYLSILSNTSFAFQSRMFLIWIMVTYIVGPK